jgi:hypothetical protein
VVGYSRLVGTDEAGTIGRLRALRKDFVEPVIGEYRGRVVKLVGDGALVEFASAVDGMAGPRDKALEILEPLQDRAKRQDVAAYALAPLHVGLGDNDNAIEALWRDYEERGSHEMLWLKVSPEFDSLRSDPRFIALLRKIGVEPG